MNGWKLVYDHLFYPIDYRYIPVFVVLELFHVVIQGETDETARTKLNNLTNRLNDKVKQGNKIVLEIPWHAGRLDLQRKEHAQYVTELCVRYEETLRLVLDRVLDAKMAYDRTRVSMVGAGEETVFNL